MACVDVLIDRRTAGRRPSAGADFASFLFAAAGGAAAMYLFDPDRGRRRRALLRDKGGRAARLSRDAADTISRDLRNRAGGVVAEFRARLSRTEVSDVVLAERVRSRIGSVVGHAGGVAVDVVDGRVALSGPILADEVGPLVRRVRSVRGVRHVDNRLDVHSAPGDVPALQGRPRPPRGGEVFELWQARWSPAARLVAGVAAGVALASGLRRLDPTSAALAVVGVTVLGRAIGNRPILGDRERGGGRGQTRGASSGLS
jgi:hypothetical protein